MRLIQAAVQLALLALALSKKAVEDKKAKKCQGYGGKSSKDQIYIDPDGVVIYRENWLAHATIDSLRQAIWRTADVLTNDRSCDSFLDFRCDCRTNDCRSCQPHIDKVVPVNGGIFICGHLNHGTTTKYSTTKYYCHRFEMNKTAYYTPKQVFPLFIRKYQEWTPLFGNDESVAIATTNGSFLYRHGSDYMKVEGSNPWVKEVEPIRTPNATIHFVNSSGQTGIDIICTKTKKNTTSTNTIVLDCGIHDTKPLAAYLAAKTLFVVLLQTPNGQRQGVHRVCEFKGIDVDKICEEEPPAIKPMKAKPPLTVKGEKLPDFTNINKIKKIKGKSKRPTVTSLLVITGVNSSYDDAQKVDVFYFGMKNGSLIKGIRVQNATKTRDRYFSLGCREGAILKIVLDAPNQTQLTMAGRNFYFHQNISDCHLYAEDCRSCIKLRDPHCIFDTTAKRCRIRRRFEDQTDIDPSECKPHRMSRDFWMGSIVANVVVCLMCLVATLLAYFSRNPDKAHKLEKEEARQLGPVSSIMTMDKSSSVSSRRIDDEQHTKIERNWTEMTLMVRQRYRAFD